MPTQLQPTPPATDALMGAQLTEQYQRAVGGMTEVLKFGAMMMMLRERYPEIAQRGGDRRSKSNVNFDRVTLREWLSEHAPEVNRTTAYRFLHVAEAVSQKFELPARVSFIELATKPAEDLDERLRKKQLELWEFVNGTSQRSWLDMFKPVESHQTYHPPRRMRLVGEDGTPLSPTELAAQAAREHEAVISRLRQDNGQLMDSLERFTRKQHYQVWNDAELDAAHVYLTEAARAVEAWRRMPKGQRLATCVQEEIATWKGLR